MTPSSFSYDFKAVLEACLAAGAKAEAEAKMEAKIADFMMVLITDRTTLKSMRNTAKSPGIVR